MGAVFDSSKGPFENQRIARRHSPLVSVVVAISHFGHSVWRLICTRSAVAAPGGLGCNWDAGRVGPFEDAFDGSSHRWELGDVNFGRRICVCDGRLIGNRFCATEHGKPDSAGHRALKLY